MKKSITNKEKNSEKKKIGTRDLIRLTEPRVKPLPFSEWDEELQKIWKRGKGVINIQRTLAHHPKLLNRWRVFGNHVLLKSSLPFRDREILILRIGWLCGSEYEWGQHVEIGKKTGLTYEEILRIIEGPDAKGWDKFDSTLLRAVDELFYDSFIFDDTWNALAEKYNTHQLMDVVFTVGQYNLVSWALNTLGVQRDEGIGGFPK
ncbi:MAG: carboxymuconolactone decarboxylase family protein [Promethearchaeota archaeon]